MGLPRAHKTLFEIKDRPTCPTFVREEPIQEPMEEVEDETFADILMAANDEWELLVPLVWEMMTFECFIIRGENITGHSDRIGGLGVKIVS